MDITKYSKKTWIATLVLGLVSIVVDILLMTGVLKAGGEVVESTTTLTLIIGLMAVYYSIRGIVYHVKKDKEQR